MFSCTEQLCSLTKLVLDDKGRKESHGLGSDIYGTNKSGAALPQGRGGRGDKDMTWNTLSPDE